MKKLSFVFTLILIFVFSAEPIFAGNLAKKTAGFGGGLIAGCVFHEGGHQVAAWYEDVNISWSGTNWSYDRDIKDREQAVIGSAGLLVDAIGQNIILGVDAIPKDNSFVLGVLAWEILNPITYTLRNEFSSDGHGDLRELRQAGIDTGLVEVGLVANSLVSLYRLYKNPDFRGFVNVTGKEIFVGWSWELF